ncbi:MAG: HPF/RaiA family ribosome-associated protein [Acidobacteria bacterium]|nr:HPF/RaiA family ribosome-associated protein [Acidobacteriota bacterium]
MKLPLQVTFRNMEHLDTVEAYIRKQAANLETYYDRIMGCRVIVEIPHRHHREGNLYHIRIDLTVPGGEVVVREEASLHSADQQIARERFTKCEEIHSSHRHVDVAIREAFEAARRRLQDYARRQRGDVKIEEPTAHACVSKLFPEKGYGFLETADGREIYFHGNSVLDGHFHCLEIGTEVIFSEEQGAKGPQASTVRYAARHHGGGWVKKGMDG